LSERERNEEAAQGQAKFLGRNAEAGANLRKGRKDDVGGKRAERREPGKQEKDSSCHPALEGSLIVIKSADITASCSRPRT
jgi:hypothetical protein